jgi:hypothetical protein
MWNQRKRYSALPVPTAMSKMKEAIERIGGLKAEGICRRSHDQYHIESMVKRANGAKSFLEDGHVQAVACLYKLWIKQIPGRLIMRRSAHAIADEYDFVEVVDELPLLHTNALRHLLGLMKYCVGFDKETKSDFRPSRLSWHLQFSVDSARLHESTEIKRS